MQALEYNDIRYRLYCLLIGKCCYIQGADKYMNCKVIAVANQKGGVGKTTTAVNLSASLAVAEARVLLIDFDPQGNATSGLGVMPDQIENDIYDVLVNGADINSALCHTEIEGLDLVPARIELSAAEVELIQELSRETKLKRAIAELKENYDYILIDCPPSLGLLTVNALTAAGSVLIPMQCEYFAMEGLGQLLNTINLIKENLNPDLTIEGILLTMYDVRNNLSKEVMNQVTTHFPDKAFKTVVPRNVALSEAPSYGKPVILYQAKARGTECYIELAKEILNKANHQEQDKE